jgi:hypothetical protein
MGMIKKIFGQIAGLVYSVFSAKEDFAVRLGLA